jgi:hypothetical protein
LLAHRVIPHDTSDWLVVRVAPPPESRGEQVDVNHFGFADVSRISATARRLAHVAWPDGESWPNRDYFFRNTGGVSGE